MSISNFTVRNTNQTQKPNLFRGSGNYDSPKLFRYPIDLGTTSKEHYMIIHINEQKRTNYASERTGDLPQIYENISRYGGSNVVDAVVPEIRDAILDKFKNYQNINPNINFQSLIRTTDTIALYMPDTLNFTYNQQYEDLKLTGLPSAVLAGGKSLLDHFRTYGLQKDKALQVFGRNVSPFILNYLANNAGDSRDISRLAFGGFFGFVQNPQLEILYSSPAMRQFNFQFMFYPRSEVEAIEVQSILNTLRFHQAPEVVTEYNAFFLTPPSEFDIKFYYNGVENPNIPKISTCVLHTLDVDYAPGGFAAYETQERSDPTVGGTGMPVGIRLSLGFKEREVLTKSHFAEDAGKTASTRGFSDWRGQSDPNDPN